MPKYRQLHTKIVDSFDFAEMPDDFTRVLWLLLIVIVDSEGRGIDSPSWIRARMFPLRPDVDLEHIEAAMDWISNRGMITRYQVDGRSYFCIASFKTYQSGTEKEAKSNLPPTPELLRSNSVPYPEQVRVNADADADADSIQKQRQEQPPSDSFSSYRRWIEEIIRVPVPPTKADVDAINEMLKCNMTKDDLQDAYNWLVDHGKTVRGASSLLQSAKTAQLKRVQSGSNNGRKPGANEAVWIEDANL